MEAKLLFLPAADIGALIGDRVTVRSAASAAAAHGLRRLDRRHRDRPDVGWRAGHPRLPDRAGQGRTGRGDRRPGTPAGSRVGPGGEEPRGRRLADADISPAALARELNVSVRTLHRAFAATEESVSAYIRRRGWNGPGLSWWKGPGRGASRSSPPAGISRTTATSPVSSRSNTVKRLPSTHGRAAIRRVVPGAPEHRKHPGGGGPGGVTGRQLPVTPPGLRCQA